jgi:hypothetical protein
MGRIGKSYPRFEPAPPHEVPASAKRATRHQVVGAIVGILSALGLIGWLLSR